MIIDIVKGISVPFLGTTLGAFCVFFLKNELSKGMQKALTGFAAGVMVAASIWSLLLPALEQGVSLGMWKFLPAVIGFWIGILFLMAIDYFAPPECIDEKCKNKLLLAVTLHNIPEGMAVGVIYAGLLSGAEHITEIGAFSLALGIEILFNSLDKLQTEAIAPIRNICDFSRGALDIRSTRSHPTLARDHKYALLKALLFYAVSGEDELNRGRIWGQKLMSSTYSRMTGNRG